MELKLDGKGVSKSEMEELEILERQTPERVVVNSPPRSTGDLSGLIVSVFI